MLIERLIKYHRIYRNKIFNEVSVFDNTSVTHMLKIDTGISNFREVNSGREHMYIQMTSCKCLCRKKRHLKNIM